MPHLSALTAQQQTDARAEGYHAEAVRLLLAPNTIVFQAQVNGADFGDTLLQLAFDNVTVGAYTDIKEGYTVYISATAGIDGCKFGSYVHKGRVRADGSYVVATSSTINIDENSAAILDDMYIMVVKDVELWRKLPKVTADVVQMDSVITFRPLLPIVYGLSTAYAEELTGANVDIAFAPSALATEDGATISTWEWFADGASFQSGSSSSQNVTLRFSSAGHYMPRVTVTDNGGQKGFFAFHVFIYDPDSQPTWVHEFLDGTLSVSANRETGYVSGFDIADSISEVLKDNFVAIHMPTNATAAATGNDIVFVGRTADNEYLDQLRAEGLGKSSIQNSTHGASGAGEQLRTLKIAAAGLEWKNGPGAFGGVDKLTWWRTIVFITTEMTNIANVFGLSFDDTSDDYQWLEHSNEGDALTFMESITERIGASANYAASGEILFARNGWILEDDTDRNALTTVLDVEYTDLVVPDGGDNLYTLSRQDEETVGRVELNGRYLMTALNSELRFTSNSPAVVATRGGSLADFSDQQVTANSSQAVAFLEGGQRAANYWAFAQPKYVLNNLQLRGGFWFLQPAGNQWYTFTLAATTNNLGQAFTTGERWILTDASWSVNNATGEIVPRFNWFRETQGNQYQNYTQIAEQGDDDPRSNTPPDPPGAGVNPPPNDYLPDNPIDDDKPGISPGQIPVDPRNPVPTFGYDATCWTATDVYQIGGLSQLTPSYKSITPPTSLGTIQDVALSLTDNYIWVLSTDGTDSRLHRSSSAGSIAYQDTDIEGVWDAVEATSTQGAIYLYATDAEVWEHTFAFDTPSGSDPNTTYGDGGFTGLFGTYTASVGWQATNGSSSRLVFIRLDIAATNFLSIEMTYDLTKGTYSPAINDALALGVISMQSQSVASGDLVNGTGLIELFELKGQSTRINAVVQTSEDDTPPVSYSGAATIRKLVIRGTGSNPFTGGSGTLGRAGSLYSTDFGETLGGVEEIADSPAITPAAFDVYNGSTKAFAAAENYLYSATAGGAWSQIPVTQATPQEIKAVFAVDDSNIVFGSSAAFGGETLWTSDLVGRVAITPNDGSSDGIVVAPQSIYQFGQRLYALCTFGVNVKLAYSTDGGSSWSFTSTIASGSYLGGATIGGWDWLAIADGTSVQVAFYDGSGTLTLLEVQAPNTLLGVEWGT